MPRVIWEGELPPYDLDSNNTSLHELHSSKFRKLRTRVVVTDEPKLYVEVCFGTDAMGEAAWVDPANYMQEPVFNSWLINSLYDLRDLRPESRERLQAIAATWTVITHKRIAIQNALLDMIEAHDNAVEELERLSLRPSPVHDVGGLFQPTHVLPSHQLTSIVEPGDSE